MFIYIKTKKSELIKYSTNEWCVKQNKRKYYLIINSDKYIINKKTFVTLFKLPNNPMNFYVNLVDNELIFNIEDI